MKIEKYTKNILPDHPSIYQIKDEFKFSNVIFRSAEIKNSPHKDNTVAFIIDDAITNERLICLEFTVREALIVIALLNQAIFLQQKKEVTNG